MSLEPANRPRPLMKPQRADDTLAAEVYSAGSAWRRIYADLATSPEIIILGYVWTS